MNIILAGCNNFMDMPSASLKGCVRDQKTLWELWNRPSANVTLLVDSDFTKQNWMQCIDDAINSQEVTWVAISSHGTSIGEGQGEAYCCHNMIQGVDGIIHDWEMRSIFDRLPPGSGLFLDTCFSGSALTPGSWQGFVASNPSLKEQDGTQFKARFYDLFHVNSLSRSINSQIPGDTIRQNDPFLGSKFVMGSCQDWETSADMTGVNGSFGLGTWALATTWKYMHETGLPILVGPLVEMQNMTISDTYGRMQAPTCTTDNWSLDLAGILEKGGL